MSNFQPKPGSGYVFLNEDKKNPKPKDDGTIPETDKWPDWKGSVNVEGLGMMGLALWKSETKEGKPMFSAKLSEFRAPESVKQPVAQQATPDLDDSIPW